MRKINVKGRTALVDDQDYDLLSSYSWYVYTRHGKEYPKTNVRINGKFIGKKMHQLIIHPKPPLVTDHINGNTYDNRKENLRTVTRLQNNVNSKKRGGGSSIYKGVHWKKDKQKWTSAVKYKGKEIYLGCFDNEQEAARAYNNKIKELFGEYALLNCISEEQKKHKGKCCACVGDGK